MKFPRSKPKCGCKPPHECCSKCCKTPLSYEDKAFLWMVSTISVVIIVMALIKHYR